MKILILAGTGAMGAHLAKILAAEMMFISHPDKNIIMKTIFIICRAMHMIPDF